MTDLAAPIELAISAALRENAEADPDRPALTHATTTGDVTLTRGELDRRTNRLARAYEQLGVKQNDLVTIALPNGLEFFEAALAVWKLGATPQPVSAKLPPVELDAIIELANTPIVVGMAEGTVSRRCVPVGFEADPTLSDEPLDDRIAESLKAPTSGGSTGRPKIILSGQRGVVQRGRTGAFAVPEESVVLIPPVRSTTTRRSCSRRADCSAGTTSSSRRGSIPSSRSS